MANGQIVFPRINKISKKKYLKNCQVSIIRYVLNSLVRVRDVIQES